MACLVASAVATTPAPAHACGGLFCSGGATTTTESLAVNQTAERVVFVDEGDGRVTAIIQILYEGEAERFAWLLPVPGVPQVQVSSTVVLDELQTATNPEYQVMTTTPSCGSSSPRPSGGGDGCGPCGTCAAAPSSPSDAYSSPAAVSEASEPVVSVEAAASIGPYDYTVISVEPAYADPAQVATTWLTDNGFDVGDLGADVLRPYLADGLNLLAIRLTKGAPVGSIRPIMITYEAELPAIPIRPTAVAATEDMSILVWVFGLTRAVPLNYRTAVLDDVALDWFAPNAEYTTLVSAAVDEASGQAFVTERAGYLDASVPTVTSPAPTVLQQGLDALSVLDGGAYDVLNRADELCTQWTPGKPCSAWDGFEEALSAAVTLPGGIAPADLVACLGAARAAMATGTPEECPPGFAWDGLQLDRQIFDERFAALVIWPVADTIARLQLRPYVTRLYTTLSPSEMTVDPVFAFNPDLQAVSQIHQAQRARTCGGTWSMTLPPGVTLVGTSDVWPVGLGTLPAALQIVQHGTSGQGQTIVDHTAELAGQSFGTLACFYEVPPADATAEDTMIVYDPVAGGFVRLPRSHEDSGCSLVTTAAPVRAPWLLVWSAGLIALLRVLRLRAKIVSPRPSRAARRARRTARRR